MQVFDNSLSLAAWRAGMDLMQEIGLAKANGRGGGMGITDVR